MIAKKNKIKSMKNTFRRGSLINIKNYESWLIKTFIRTIISAVLIMIVIIIQILNFQTPKKALNYVTEKLEYSASIETYIAGFKKLPSYITSVSNKALEAVKVEENLGKRFLSPVSGDIVAYFNENIGQTSNVSKGLLFSSEVGKNILSVDDGVVIETGSNKSIGNYIIIKHKGELLSVYKYVGGSKVELNQRVEKGQVIGISGEKLLLEVWYRNEPIDPIQYMDLSVQGL